MFSLTGKYFGPFPCFPCAVDTLIYVWKGRFSTSTNETYLKFAVLVHGNIAGLQILEQKITLNVLPKDVSSFEIECFKRIIKAWRFCQINFIYRNPLFLPLQIIRYIRYININLQDIYCYLPCE